MNHPHRSRARQARIIREAERWSPILKPLSSYEAAEKIAWQMSTLSEYTARAETLGGALLAVAGLAQPDDGWQPIETAPKDGTIIDVWLGDVCASDAEFYCLPGTRRSAGWHWHQEKWRPYTGLPGMPTFVEPTHWRPLPTPPDALISP